jgi:hypothetical protein
LEEKKKYTILKANPENEQDTLSGEDRLVNNIIYNGTTF